MPYEEIDSIGHPVFLVIEITSLRENGIFKTDMLASTLPVSSSTIVNRNFSL